MTKAAVSQAVRELTGPTGALKATRTLNSVVSKLSESKGGGGGGGGGGKAGLLSRLRPGSASAKPKDAHPHEHMLLELDLGDEVGGASTAVGGSKEATALSRMLQKDRSVAKQVLARHLLTRSFDVLERRGVKPSAGSRPPVMKPAPARRTDFDGDASLVDRAYGSIEDGHDGGELSSPEADEYDTGRGGSTAEYSGRRTSVGINLIPSVLGRPLTGREVRVGTREAGGAPAVAPYESSKIFVMGPQAQPPGTLQEPGHSGNQYGAPLREVEKTPMRPGARGSVGSQTTSTANGGARVTSSARGVSVGAAASGTGTATAARSPAPASPLRAPANPRAYTSNVNR